MGEFIVEIVKFSFSFSTKSHAAFSANVLLALWTVSGQARSNLIAKGAHTPVTVHWVLHPPAPV